MHLEIVDDNKVITIPFISWLLIKIRNHFILNIDPKKLISWNKYLNNNPVYKSIYKKNIDARDVLIAGIMNLRYIKEDNYIDIFIDNNLYTPGLDRIKLKSICKLINFGNMEMKAYPIFTDTFKYFADNLQEYLNLYFYGIA